MKNESEKPKDADSKEFDSSPCSTKLDEWNTMMDSLDRISRSLYDQGEGDDGYVIMRAMTRLSKQRESIASYQRKFNP